MKIKLLCKCDMGDVGDVVDVDKKGAKAMVDARDAEYDFDITKEEAIKLNKRLPKNRKKKKKPIEEQPLGEPEQNIEGSGKILDKEPILNGDNPKWLIIKEQITPPNKQELEMVLKGENTDWLKKKVFIVSDPNQWKCLKCYGIFISEKKPIMCKCCNRGTYFEQITDEIDVSLWKLPRWEDIPVENLDMQNTYIDLKNLLKKTVIFPDDIQYDIFALWIIATWKPECWDSIAFLIFRGLIETGKSRALELIYELGHRMMFCSSITFPAMQRATKSYHAGLLIDEIDNKIDMKTESGKSYIDFLKASYKRKETYKCADLENQEKIISYPTYGFKAFAGEKGGYDDAIFSRSVDFQMEQVYPEIDELGVIQKDIDKIQTVLLNYRYKTTDPPMLPDSITLKGRDREIFSCVIRTAINIGIEYQMIIDFINERKKEKQQEIENSDEYAILKLLREKECNPTLDDAPESISYSEIADALDWEDKQRQKLGYIFKKKFNLKTKRKNKGSVLLLNDEKNIHKLKGLYRRYNL